jgi:CRISPR-associated endoribonuclease Cas6
MRLHLALTPSREPVPFAHLHRLTGFLHRCVGQNAEHDAMSLYSFGQLRGGRLRRDQREQFLHGYLSFPGGARWWVSFYDPGMGKAFLRGLLEDPEVFAGMTVTEVQEGDDPPRANEATFAASGPILTRLRRDDGTREHLSFDDPRATETLTRTLRAKLRAAGFEGEHLEASMHFDESYHSAKTKVVQFKNTEHRGNLCPVVVSGTPEAVAFAYAVGAGELTGSGFGGLE